jgi:hypothetical protein
MKPGIFLLQGNDELVEMNEQAYDSESLLQTLLAKYPALLVGNQIDPVVPRRWLLIERESGVPSKEGGAGRWSADHLFLDQDAIPTIVEVKRSTDTRIRREVVGQMLDYAANAVVYWPVEYMRERFAVTCESCELDVDEQLKSFLGEDVEPEEFWQMANKNLQDRKIRLLFVADEIPTELQRIVEFLNEQMDRTEVLAIEIKQFVGEGLTGLVPRVIGRTAQAQQVKVPGERAEKKDEVSFFQTMQETTSIEDSDTASRILYWSRENFSHINWGSASFSPALDYNSEYTHNPITVYTGGKIRIRFNRMQHKTAALNSEPKRRELLRRFNEIAGINLPLDCIAKAPTILISTLYDPGLLNQFLSVIAWTIEEVKAEHQVTKESSSSTVGNNAL